jgi:hypothetical protein
MPHSKKAGKATIQEWVSILKSEGKIQHNRALDLGVGEGAYFNWLNHLYVPGGDKFKTMDQNWAINQGPLAGAFWLGIEIWTPYIKKFNLEDKYNKIINDDIRTVDYSSMGYFDVAIAGDVLEHMSKEDAVSVVNKVLDISTYLFINIPIIHYPQEEYDGNPYEAHIKDDWSHKEMRDTFPQILKSKASRRVGVYMLTKNDNKF